MCAPTLLLNNDENSYDHNENALHGEQKEDIVEYCKSLIHTSFHGVSGVDKTFYNTCIDTTFSDDSVSDSCHQNVQNDVGKEWDLGLTLKLLGIALKNHFDEGYAKDTEGNLLRLLNIVARKRMKRYGTIKHSIDKLSGDLKVFLKYYKKRGALDIDVADSYWGSRNQLLAGKIIVDNISSEDVDVKMDPIFGVLLCPFAGIRDPTNITPSQIDSYQLDQNYWFDYDLPTKTYHAIMYDSFKYLKEYHNAGPGEDYLQQSSLFHPDPLSGQTTSFLFWKRLFDRIYEEDICIKMHIV